MRPRPRPRTVLRALRWETVRASLMRPALLAAQGSGVFLLVAIQHFDAGSTAKALIAASTFLGMLVSPVIVTVVAGRQLPANRAVAFLLFVSGLALGLAGVSPSLAGFLIGVLLGAPLLEGVGPLVIGLWQQNVPGSMRGRLFALVSSGSGLVGIASGLVIAAVMGDEIARYRPVVLALALGVVLAGWAALRIPGRPLTRSVRNPLRLLSLLWRNPLFGYLSVSWMLLGFGNLATIPLRTEYVATGAFGLAYSARLVLYLTIVIPQAVALLAVLGWGRLFDRVNFLHLRLALNTVFITSILLYFRPSLPSQILGSILYGVGQGGGMVQWNLWVTRYAPRERTADYMAVHSFLTGVRGITAPFLAYALLDRLPLVTVTTIGWLLLLVASLLIVPLLHPRLLSPGGAHASSAA